MLTDAAILSLKLVELNLRKTIQGVHVNHFSFLSLGLSGEWMWERVRVACVCVFQLVKNQSRVNSTNEIYLSFINSSREDYNYYNIRTI